VFISLLILGLILDFTGHGVRLLLKQAGLGWANKILDYIGIILGIYVFYNGFSMLGKRRR
jgi:hypothetical protein